MRSLTQDPADRIRTLVGHRYRASRTYAVTNDRIDEFVRIAHDRHPMHRNDSVGREFGFNQRMAPPTFGVVAITAAHYDALDALLPGVDPNDVLHTGQTLSIGRLLAAGDVLTTDMFIASARVLPDYAAIDIGVTLRDLDGAIVLTGTSAIVIASSTFTWRGDEAVSMPHDQMPTGLLAPARPYRTPRRSLRLSAGTEFDSRLVAVDPADIESFQSLCGAPPSASSIGQHVIYTGAAPGMLRLSVAAGYLTSVFDDPMAIRRYSTEFTHYCLPASHSGSQHIDFTARVTAVDPLERRAAIGLGGTCSGRGLFARAEAELDLRTFRFTGLGDL